MASYNKTINNPKIDPEAVNSVSRVIESLLKVLLLSLVLMLLWNLILVDIIVISSDSNKYSLPLINYWQSIGLYFISDILFKQKL